MSHGAYLAQCTPSPYIAVPGSRVENWYGDLMHNDLMGIGGNAGASTVARMVENDEIPGNGWQAKLNHLTVACNDNRKKKV